MITTDERIITAVTMADGAYIDCTKFGELIDLTQQTGLDIIKVYGSKEYFRKPILDKINGIETKPYIRDRLARAGFKPP